jgi:hypothetical protein
MQRRLIWLSLTSSPLLFLVAVWGLVGTPLEGGAAVSAPAVLVPALLAVSAFIAATRWLDGWMGPADPDGAERRRLTLLIIRLAMFEAIAVLGLVAAVLSQDLTVYLPFMVLSLVGMVLYRPQG